MNKDIENFVNQCQTCQRVCRKNVSQPLVETETLKTAFESIRIDILEIPTKNMSLQSTKNFQNSHKT